jgi:hypothetical protein
VNLNEFNSYANQQLQSIDEGERSSLIRFLLADRLSVNANEIYLKWKLFKTI